MPTPANQTEYRINLRNADELEAKLRRMSGDEDNFFDLQTQWLNMEAAMSEYSMKVNGYANHRFAPLR